MLFKILLTVFLLVSNRSSADTGISGVATCHGRPVNVFVELEKQGVTGPVTLNSMPSEGGNFTIATWRAFEEDKTYYLEIHHNCTKSPPFAECVATRIILNNDGIQDLKEIPLEQHNIYKASDQCNY
ncbi:unnamed protein product [Bursaphelenchus xylophilus]|uniref:(pine wood nematode) hypothetical protein n=1 Tax=Bursaphelenchus xylophilus TaxID=6326 RepID=A0A7I8XFS9_BURXY|nr:unnamed protein product [Bursaphelenchus xylophilus]CAG9080338.1 unnamed protein product [Bursaphelenchus xylophilus]